MADRLMPELREGDWISRLSAPQGYWSQIRVLDSCVSTQNEARAAAAAGHAGGLVIAARTQTGGRGRLDRPWDSGRGGLWFSVLIKAPRGRESGGFSLAAALAVREGLAGFLPVPVAVKWPNDVLVRGCKIAGILLETSIATDGSGWMIAGIGINVNNAPDPARAPGAACAAVLAGGFLDPSRVLSAVLSGLCARIEAFTRSGFGSMAGEYARHCFLRGRSVRVQQGISALDGVVDGVDAEGRLVLRDGAGAAVAVSAGTVTVLSPS